MMFVDHTQTSQGFSGGLSVGVWEAKASGGDEPGFHVGLATGTETRNPTSFYSIRARVWDKFSTRGSANG